MSIATQRVETLSRSARSLLRREAGSPVPQGTVETAFHPMEEALKPLGMHALSCETLR